jgi:hypothetical protein
VGLLGSSVHRPRQRRRARALESRTCSRPDAPHLGRAFMQPSDLALGRSVSQPRGPDLAQDPDPAHRRGRRRRRPRLHRTTRSADPRPLRHPRTTPDRRPHHPAPPPRARRTRPPPHHAGAGHPPLAGHDPLQQVRAATQRTPRLHPGRPHHRRRARRRHLLRAGPVAPRHPLHPGTGRPAPR